MPSSRLPAACAVLLLALRATPASAQLDQWQGPTTGSWDDPASWSQGTSPGPGHYVLITPATGADVTGPAAPTAIELLGINAMASGTAALALQPGGYLAITQKLMIGRRGRLAIDGATASAAETIVAGAIALGEGATLESAAQLLNFGRIEARPAPSAHLAGGPVYNLGSFRTEGDGLFGTELVIDDDFVNAGSFELVFADLEVGGDFINVATFDHCFGSVTAPNLIANTGDAYLDFCGWSAPVVYNTGNVGDGVWIKASTLVNEGRIGVSSLDGGGIEAETVINRGSIAIVEYTRVSADIDVRESGSLSVRESSSVAGLTTVAGSLGTGTASFESLVFRPTATFFGSPDDFGDPFTLTVAGDLFNESERADAFEVFEFESVSTLHLGGGSGSHVFTHPGADLGPVEGGYADNFAWPGLRLAAGDQLVIEDGNATPGIGLYVQRLELQGGIAQIASITGNGANLYYDPDEPANAYLGGQTYPLGGGGAIVPVE